MFLLLLFLGFSLSLFFFFFLNFDHFNCNGSFCGSVLIYFTLKFLKVLYIEVCFLPRLGKFSATISSKKLLWPFSLLFSSGTHTMWMLIYLTLSQRPLWDCHFLKYFSCSVEVSSSALSSNSLVLSSRSSNMLLNLFN